MCKTPNSIQDFLLEASVKPFTNEHAEFQDTFTRAKNWVKELQRQASPNIVIALAGNKADLANKRAVDFQVCASLDKGSHDDDDDVPQACFLTSAHVSSGSAGVRRRQQPAVHGDIR